MNNIMPPINTPDNAFHDGNPATGEQGTIVPGLLLNNSQGATRNIQQEIISVVAEAEIEIDETKDNQLLTAILSLITASIPDLPVASLTQAGIVKLISSLTSDSESLAATAKAVKLVANAIVTSMSDHIQTANPHHQYLAIANFLSEIKDVGPAAVAQTLLNLGLGDVSRLLADDNATNIKTANGRYMLFVRDDGTWGCWDSQDSVVVPLSSGLGSAARRAVGTGENQIPDMSAWTHGGDDLNGWKRSPDGYIEQWGVGTYSDAQIVSLHIPFTTTFSTVLITSDPGQTTILELSQAWPVNNTSFKTGCAVIAGGGTNPASLLCKWRAYGK